MYLFYISIYPALVKLTAYWEIENKPKSKQINICNYVRL